MRRQKTMYTNGRYSEEIFKENGGRIPTRVYSATYYENGTPMTVIDYIDGEISKIVRYNPDGSIMPEPK